MPKKSYFILNDKIVFLGTGIKSTDSSKNPVTTIENRKANDYKLYKDVRKQPIPIIRKPIPSF
ncbi:TPA: polysaccharide lyase family 8 super-sandwich domain-containing protein [Staphylococcus aureus]